MAAGASGAPARNHATATRGQAPASGGARHDAGARGKQAPRKAAPPHGPGKPRRGAGRAKRVVIAVLAVVAALAVAFVVLSHTDVFKITAVHVTNSSRLSDDYLTAQVAIPQGTNLLNLDAAAVTQRLEANPWVKSVKIHREFPNTLGLEIEEGFPAALVQIEPAEALGAIQYWLISGDGVWMSQVSSTGVEAAQALDIGAGDQGTGGEDGSQEQPEQGDQPDDSQAADPSGADGGQDGQAAEPSGDTGSEAPPSVCEDAYLTVDELATIPCIRGVATGVVPQAGVAETDEGLLNSLGILRQLDQEFRDQVASIVSATDNTTSVTLKNGVEIAFGVATDMDEKIAVVEKLLEQYADSIAYINMRVVDHPTFRTVDG